VTSSDMHETSSDMVGTSIGHTQDIDNSNSNSNSNSNIKNLESSTSTPPLLELEPDPPPDPNKPEEIAKRVVGRLNERIGSNFRWQTAKTLSLVKARLREGFTEDEFLEAIGWCIYEWGEEPEPGQHDMRQYLRPQTIFGSKMDSYVQQFNRVKSESEQEGQHA